MSVFSIDDYFLVTKFKIIMNATELAETHWQVINKILNLQERKPNIICVRYGIPILHCRGWLSMANFSSWYCLLVDF